jgi:hypothetical protein
MGRRALDRGVHRAVRRNRARCACAVAGGRTALRADRARDGSYGRVALPAHRWGPVRGQAAALLLAPQRLLSRHRLVAHVVPDSGGRVVRGRCRARLRPWTANRRARGGAGRGTHADRHGSVRDDDARRADRPRVVRVHHTLAVRSSSAPSLRARLGLVLRGRARCRPRRRHEGCRLPAVARAHSVLRVAGSWVQHGRADRRPRLAAERGSSRCRGRRRQQRFANGGSPGCLAMEPRGAGVRTRRLGVDGSDAHRGCHPRRPSARRVSGRDPVPADRGALRRGTTSSRT